MNVRLLQSVPIGKRYFENSCAAARHGSPVSSGAASIGAGSAVPPSILIETGSAPGVSVIRDPPPGAPRFARARGCKALRQNFHFWKFGATGRRLDRLLPMTGILGVAVAGPAPYWPGLDAAGGSSSSGGNTKYFKFSSSSEVTSGRLT